MLSSRNDSLIAVVNRRRCRLVSASEPSGITEAIWNAPQILRSSYCMVYGGAGARKRVRRAGGRLDMILLTSATGSMGRNLIDVPTSDGADVRAVTRHP